MQRSPEVSWGRRPPDEQVALGHVAPNAAQGPSTPAYVSLTLPSEGGGGNGLENPRMRMRRPEKSRSKRRFSTIR